jgi:hypothetical protein
MTILFCAIQAGACLCGPVLAGSVNVPRGHTSTLTAHRMHLVDLADMVVVLDDGAITRQSQTAGIAV